MNRLRRLFPMTMGFLVAILIFGCSDAATAPTNPELAIARTRPPALVECEPQRFASTSGWIGPRGGRLKAGNHMLFVPAGALNANTLITMEARSGGLSQVAFGPEGLTFNSGYPAFLVMSYQECSVAGVAQRIALLDESLRIIETAPSYDDRFSQTVQGELTRFSDFAFSTYAVVY